MGLKTKTFTFMRTEVQARCFRAFLVGGTKSAYEVANHHREAHALSERLGPLGDLAVTEGDRDLILRDAAARSVFLAHANVVPTSSTEKFVPVITALAAAEKSYPSGFTGGFRKSPIVTGGAAPTLQDQPTFGLQRVPVHNWWPDAIEIELNLLEDAPAIESLLRGVFSDTLAIDTDAQCTTGSGVLGPLGILTDHADFVLPTINSGHASLLTYDGLVDLLAALPDQYRQNAAFLMSSVTYAAILKLKDSSGQPMFPANASTLWGRPILFNEFMPAVGAGAYPIVLGDMKYFVIALRQDLRVIRSVERFAPNIGLQPWARLGGQTIRPNAFRRLKVSA